MTSYTVQSIQGVGHRVVSNQGKVVGTFDDQDEAEARQNALNTGSMKEHELWENDNSHN